MRQDHKDVENVRRFVLTGVKLEHWDKYIKLFTDLIFIVSIEKFLVLFYNFFY